MAPPRPKAAKSKTRPKPKASGGVLGWFRRHPVPTALGAALVVFGAVLAERALMTPKPGAKPRLQLPLVADPPPLVMEEPPRPFRIPRLPEVPPAPVPYPGGDSALTPAPPTAPGPAPVPAPVIVKPASQEHPAPIPAPVTPVEVATLPPPPPPAPTGREGQPAWIKYAVPASLPVDRPAIAVIIDDLGVDRKRSARVVKLPGPLTLAWIPYAGDLKGQTQAARVAGHELLLHMPMEPEGGDEDPGPGALLTSLGKDEAVRRLEKGLTSFDGFVGVNNHMGSKFTANRTLMEPVLAVLKQRGLLWVDSKTTAASVGPGIARSIGLPNASRDVFLDNELSVAAVRAQLAKAEEVAHRHGVAVAIGHPHDTTVEALAAWLPTLAKRGFTLVPVSAIVKARHAGG
ncbi:MAG TPA: divergent polysaccharide deacetylase family protein [Azospirillaceae bacterium]|nr:divergent polysaccharide deacetylase family protein [Azospirillaceae bacterium]